MEMSVFELLAIARETAGADYVKGDRILCEKRYSADTEHMLEFRILGGREPYGKQGDHCRMFLTGEAYCMMQEKYLIKWLKNLHIKSMISLRKNKTNYIFLTSINLLKVQNY